MKNIFFLLLFVSLLGLSSCIPQAPVIQGPETEVFIKVVHPLTGEPVEGAYVNAWGESRDWRQGNHRLIRENTDSTGELSVKFRAELGKTYKIQTLGRIDDNGLSLTFPFFQCEGEAEIEAGEVQTFVFEKVPKAYFDLRIEADSSKGPADFAEVKFESDWDCDDWVFRMPLKTTGLGTYDYGRDGNHFGFPSGPVRMIKRVSRGGVVREVVEELNFAVGDTVDLLFKY
ncbi:MAG: hypothetical protein AAFY71_00025 [Bacteroidota bacterium]